MLFRSGGCDWQHLEPAAQHESKLAVVRESFARTARMQVEPRLRVLDAAARRSTVRMVADHAAHSGVFSGNALARCSMAFSTGCRASGGRPGDLLDVMRRVRERQETESGPRVVFLPSINLRTGRIGLFDAEPAFLSPDSAPQMIGKIASAARACAMAI